MVALEPVAGTVGAIRWSLVAVGAGGAILGPATLIESARSPPGAPPEAAGDD